MKPPKSHADQMRANRQSMRQWASAVGDIFGKSGPEVPAEKPKVFRTARDRVPHKGEGDVQREILHWLHHDKRVVLVERHNSGALPNESGRRIQFNRVRKQGERGLRLVDITGSLTNGGKLAIEVKEPEWREPDWQKLQVKDWLTEKEARELGQKAYLDTVRALPLGIALFATDVQQVIEALSTI